MMGLPGQGFTARKGVRTRKLEKDNQNDLARTGQPEQNNQDRANRQDRQKRTFSTALSGRTFM
jgi:hypothetical protein